MKKDEETFDVLLVGSGQHGHGVLKNSKRFKKESFDSW